MSTLTRPATAGARAATGRWGGRSGRLQVSMLAAGVAVFAVLYFPQPLLPQLSAAYAVSVAVGSLAVSCATGALAISVVTASAVAERIGRARAMRIGLLTACALTVLMVAATQWWQILLLRGLAGVAVAGVVATAVAHIGAEADPRHLGSVMGVYIGGTSLGGVLGRILPGLVVDAGSWRAAALAVTALATVAAATFAVLVPSSSAASPRPRTRATALLREPVVRRLCLAGFCLMGAYVSGLNYVAYLLTGPTFGLPAATASLVFVVAATGTISAPVAGRLADRHGPRIVAGVAVVAAAVGIGLTLDGSLGVFVAGLFVFTAAFFAAHAVVNAGLSRHAGAERSRAASWYLTAYYLGSSVAGTLTGLLYQAVGWPGVVGAIVVLLLGALWAVARSTRPAGVA